MFKKLIKNEMDYLLDNPDDFEQIFEEVKLDTDLNRDLNMYGLYTSSCHYNATNVYLCYKDKYECDIFPVIYYSRHRVAYLHFIVGFKIDGEMKYVDPSYGLAGGLIGKYYLIKYGDNKIMSVNTNNRLKANINEPPAILNAMKYLMFRFFITRVSKRKPMLRFLSSDFILSSLTQFNMHLKSL